MVIDFRQRRVKIKLVWKILNQGKIWTTTYILYCQIHLFVKLLTDFLGKLQELEL